MRAVLTLVWYPWTEGQTGPAGTQGAFRTLDLALDEAPWPRLPGLGETIFFDDGGSAPVEAVGWKLDGTAYLYLGKRYEKRGEALAIWTTRGFTERPQAPGATPEAGDGEAPATEAMPPAPADPPPMPDQPA